MILYAGVERDSNNGDSFAGFWLFKGDVGCDPATGQFTGQHTDGDVLILTQLHRWRQQSARPGLHVARGSDRRPRA